MPPNTPTTLTFSISVLLTLGAAYFFVAGQGRRWSRALKDV